MIFNIYLIYKFCVPLEEHLGLSGEFRALGYAVCEKSYICETFPPMKLWQKGFDISKEIETFTVGRDRELDVWLA